MKNIGEVTLYWGTMFSGKTTRLIQDLMEAGAGSICFKPDIDDRYGTDVVKSHDGFEIPAIPIKMASQIFLFLTDNITTVGIEEASLFKDDPTLIPTIKCLRDMGLNIIITGLDRTSEDEPFYQMPQIAAIADNCYKLRAKCKICGQPASISFYKGYKSEQIKIGGSESYTPLCRNCCSKIKGNI